MSTTEAEVGVEVRRVPSGFNWGAFLFTGIFLLCNRRVGTALILMLVGGVLGGVLGDGGGAIVGIASLLVSLYFGFNAKQIAWDTGRYSTFDELERSMRRWNIGGFLVTGAAIVLGVLISLG